ADRAGDRGHDRHHERVAVAHVPHLVREHRGELALVRDLEDAARRREHRVLRVPARCERVRRGLVDHVHLGHRQLRDARDVRRDASIAAAPPSARATLRQLRKTITDAAPGATETISYRMPYYSYRGRLIYFALMRDWAGLYMLGGANRKFGKELAPYLSGVSTA